jgi:hypothetical protein
MLWSVADMMQYGSNITSRRQKVYLLPPRIAKPRDVEEMCRCFYSSVPLALSVFSHHAISVLTIQSLDQLVMLFRD